MSYELTNNIIYNYSKQISYVPAIAKELKSIESAIILNRIFFYWKTKSKYFYKFKEPCTHEWYREGDSWTEELSITRKVFDNALKKISIRIKKGVTTEHNKMIEHWTTNNVTYYQINLKNWNSFNQKLFDNETFRKSKKDFDKLQKGTSINNTDYTSDYTSLSINKLIDKEQDTSLKLLKLPEQINNQSTIKQSVINKPQSPRNIIIRKKRGINKDIPIPKLSSTEIISTKKSFKKDSYIRGQILADVYANLIQKTKRFKFSGNSANKLKLLFGRTADKLYKNINTETNKFYNWTFEKICQMFIKSMIKYEDNNPKMKMNMYNIHSNWHIKEIFCNYMGKNFVGFIWSED